MDFWATEFASVLAFQGPKCRSVSVPARVGLKVGKVSANGGRLAGKTPRRPPKLQHNHSKVQEGDVDSENVVSCLRKKLHLDPAPPAHPLNCGPTPDRGKKLDSETRRRSGSRHEAEAKPGKVIGDSRNLYARTSLCRSNSTVYTLHFGHGFVASPAEIRLPKSDSLADANLSRAAAARDGPAQVEALTDQSGVPWQLKPLGAKET